MKALTLDRKLFISLTATFILMTVVGTLTHELGHYSAARLLGYQASINYRSASHWDEELREFRKTYAHEIKNNLDFPGKERHDAISAQYRKDGFWITLGGPLQTILTGSIGFILLLVYRKKVITSDNVTLSGWVLVFLALFWLRQIANLFMRILSYFSEGHSTIHGDEMRLAYHLGIHTWSIQIITGIIGAGVLLTVLRLIPQKLVFTFLISGMVGGALGYYLWLIKFGKLIMP
jgi:hypothetical protein